MTDEQVYGAVVKLWREKGFSPSVRDIASVLGVSASTAYRRLRKLAESGAIRMPGGTHRSIEPTGMAVVIDGSLFEIRTVS